MSIKLSRFYRNPFDDEAYSVTELVRYGGESLGRMVADNPGGAVNAAITATANLLQAVDGAVSSETVRLGVQKAATQAKNDFRVALPNALSKLYGATLTKYGKKGAPMLAVWPGGLDAFNAANDAQLDPLLDALHDALAARTAELGADPAAAAGALAAEWTDLFGVLNTGKGQKMGAGEVRRGAVMGLRRQLFLNVLLLASLFPGDEAKGDYYHPQHLLENPQPAATPPAKVETPVSPAGNPPA